MSDEIAELMAEFDFTRAEAADFLAQQKAQEAEQEARGSCAVCKHYRPDPEAGRRYFGVPNAESGWCTDSDPHADMLSGDWCPKFEAK